MSRIENCIPNVNKLIGVRPQLFFMCVCVCARVCVCVRACSLCVCVCVYVCVHAVCVCGWVGGWGVCVRVVCVYIQLNMYCY